MSYNSISPEVPPIHNDLLHLGELPPCVIVVPKVLFVSHEDDGNVRTEVLHLWCPFLWNVLCEMETQ